MNGRKIKRILLAESPDVMPLALEAFGVRDSDVPMIGMSETGTVCLFIPCTSLAVAESFSLQNIDLIVCGLQFDESRMFDLLRKVKAEPATRDIPFLCVKAVSGTLDRTIYESIKIATQALGATGFYDVAEQRRLMGEEAAVRQIGAYIYRLASGDTFLPLTVFSADSFPATVRRDEGRFLVVRFHAIRHCFRTRIDQ